MMEKETSELPRAIELLQSFYHVQKNIMRYVQKAAVESGLTVPQYTILTTVAQYAKMSQKKVGEVTFFPKSTLSQAVDGLVRANYLSRAQMEGNRREIQLMITDEGVEFLKSVHNREDGLFKIFQSAIQTLSEKQYEGLLEAHRQLADFLERQGNEKGGN